MIRPSPRPFDPHPFRAGAKAPPVMLGRLAADGEPEGVWLLPLIRGRKVILVGVPGAFTPTCTRYHIPAFIAEAGALKARGLEVICVAPNDPWTVAAWAAQIDPERRITFLSDGNEDLARCIGALQTERGLFLGRRTSRYVAVIHDGIVQTLKIEPTLVEITCTRPRDAAEACAA